MASLSWKSRACRSAIIVTLTATGLALASGFSVLVGVGLAKVWFEPADIAVAEVNSPTQAPGSEPYSEVLYETDFLRDLATGKAFKRLKKSRNWSNQSSLGRIPDQNLLAKPSTNHSRTYRTVCVRLCDGYYFPISASTTRSRFARDARACRSRCGGDTRLFAYPTAGGSPETMKDTRGREYASLATAFLYRTKYDASCKCKAHPWEPEAIRAHQLYATKGWQKKAKRLARISARKFRRSRKRGNRTFAGSRYVRHLVSKTSAINVVDNDVQRNGSIGISVVGGGNTAYNRSLTRERRRRNYMGLGAKPRKVRRQRARSRPRRRNWKDNILGGSLN